MKFGDDWTGVFLRGDDAILYGMMLEQLLHGLPKELPPEIALHAAILRGFIDLLKGSHEFSSAPRDCQTLRPFEECVKP